MPRQVTEEKQSMPVLNTIRQEVFCHLVSEGRTYTEAAVSAGYSKRSASCLGSQLMHQTHIRQRVLELRAARPETTRESVLAALAVEGALIPTSLVNGERVG
jgi:phage terminase small subunit